MENKSIMLIHFHMLHSTTSSNQVEFLLSGCLLLASLVKSNLLIKHRVRL